MILYVLITSVPYENNKNENPIHPQLNLNREESLLTLLLTNQIKPSLCTKFIKKSYISNNNIPFPRKNCICRRSGFFMLISYI